MDTGKVKRLGDLEMYVRTCKGAGVFITAIAF